MSLVRAILSEIKVEFPSTVKILQRVPAEKLGWSPHAKSMTLGKLAWHIASLPKNIEGWLRAGEFDLGSRKASPHPETTGEIVSAFEANTESVRGYFQSVDDAALMEPFTLRYGDKVVSQMPKASVARGVLLNHAYHHRGQLSVYLRLLDVPVPAIYGVSADENPFA